MNEEYLMDLGFPAAQARLASMIHGGLLAGVSEEAYGDGLADMVRAEPAAAGPGPARLAGVRHRDLVTRDGCAVLALRWEVTGPGGTFPTLDADITLTPAGEHATRLSLAGAYRPPLPAFQNSRPGNGTLQRAATATARSLLARIAGILALPESPADGLPGSSSTRATGR